MKLKSKDFKNNSYLPSTFTADGENISPQLQWQDFPNETKSFVLTCIDPDAPSGDFIHWIVYDIPKDIDEIKQAGKAGKELENDFEEKSYGGPAPPSGTHRYIFTIFALDIENLNADREDFFIELKKHAIDSAKIIGLYNRIE